LASIDIDQFIRIIRKNHKNLNAPVITFMASKGSTPFEILVSTLLSLRTKDEVTLGAASRLFAKARTPDELLALSSENIEKLIYPVGFYHTKAERLLSISQIILEKYDGRVPDDMDQLLALPGVGRKTANLVLSEGFGQQAVCVDTHVHRISNRIGYVDTPTPEKTEFALREKLPRKYWNDYNEMLVALGQTICKPVSPFCSRCPATRICPKNGVTRSR
jgi:endonuclease III